MKRISSIILGFLLITTIGCSSEKEFTPSGNDSSEEKTSTAVSQETEQEKTSETSKENGKLSVDEQVLYDSGGIRITLKSTEISDYNSFRLPVLIENDSDTAICVQIRDESVNGVMFDSIMSSDVAAGKKTNDTIYFSFNDDRLVFDTISDISFRFHIFRNDNWATIADTEIMTITTNRAEYSYMPNESGDVVFDQNGIKIIYQGLSKSFMGVNVLFLIENNTNRYICVQSRDSSINGFMADSIMSSSVLPGKVAYTDMTFWSTELDKNEITFDTIEEVEFYLHIFDEESWNTIQDTGIITITVD